MKGKKPIVWVVSYGGSGTNWLNNMLRPGVVDREWWRNGPCHAPKPLPDAPCTACVYIYRHPVQAYISQHRRNIHMTNQIKLGYGAPFKPKKFARAMCEQMEAWLNPVVPFPVVLVRYESLNGRLDELANALGVKALPKFAPPDRPYRHYPIFNNAVRAWMSMPDYMVIQPKG